ncbi:carboxypeptidase regulatory-like domain-containing protein, partial [bacterium]|nr:carboxypeptidase regulatory-like domain-containing protein [bacterium]
ADLLGGYAAQGELDDFLLANGDVAIIIEDIDHLHGAGLSGGNIVDAAVAPYWADEMDSHFTLLEEHPRQAVYDTVYVESDGSGGEAVIVARGVDSGNADLEVTTRYRLTAGVRYIVVETTVLNHGASISGYSAGDALNWWGGGTHFAPGYGFDITGMTTYSAWIGATGASTCYGYTIDSGTLTCTHGDLWSDAIVFSGSISAGASQTFTRYFVVGDLGLGSVSDVAHEIRGTSVGTVAGTITDADTGEPIPSATVSCDVGGTSTYTQARSDTDGNYSATLYAGSYTFKASVPSYLPTQEDASITVSQTTTVDFELDPGEWTPANTDTLTVVMRPILSVPTMLTPGDPFTIDAMAPQATTGWAALLRRGGIEVPLAVTGAEFEPDRQRWFITATVPGSTQPELYDLVVSASDSIYDVARHAVSVKKEGPDDFYFIHITDPHMPTHLFYYQEGAESDSTEMDDMRAVINDINLINPAFVLLTGDVVNEGELEEYLNWRSFTRAKHIMREFDVPVYITGGNHDLGGWESTPPPDGTARRTWWRFFGWRWLNDPPPGEVIYTQNYSFDYGGVH